MKTYIFTTAMLMALTLTVQAQSSRRNEREKNKKETTTNNKSKEKVDNSRTYKPEDSKKQETRTTESRREPVRTERTNTESQRTPANTNTQESRRESTNQNNRQDYNESRRGEERHDSHSNERKVVVVNTPPRRIEREYVHIDHTPRRVVTVNHSNNYNPRPVEYRRVHYAYRAPVRREIIWSVEFSNNFRIYYPEVRHWRYEVGYHIPVVSAYDAFDYIGDVARVYGRVFDMYYEPETDDYYLYFGDYYPYHDFTVIVPGREARLISRRPSRYFRHADITVTGYITATDDKPEVVIRNASQLDIY